MPKFDIIANINEDYNKFKLSPIPDWPFNIPLCNYSHKFVKSILNLIKLLNYAIRKQIGLDTPNVIKKLNLMTTSKNNS